ncbi:MAG: Ig-like domain-containing protein [Candidatus Ancaeobacter aquaticus]|nr:Ig-like domain-containing protein [Candidatus Ancaeobacter aquaticus]
MRKYLKILFIVVLMSVSSSTIYASNVSVKSMPPVVVKTVPESGSRDVAPGIMEIKVTFSKPMHTRNMWSWVQVTQSSFPKFVGRVRFLEDKKTCVAPVKLEPGKAYAIWFNNGRFNSFRDKNDHPAVPYLLVFQTKRK